MNPVRRSTRTARPVRKLEESFLIQVPKKTTKEAANSKTFDYVKRIMILAR